MRFHILSQQPFPGADQATGQPAQPPSPVETGAELDALLHGLHPCGQAAFAQLWGERSGLRSTCLLHCHSLQEHSVGREWRWRQDGRKSPFLPCRIPGCTDRDCPSVSILLCSPGKHIVPNTCSRSYPFSASPVVLVPAVRMPASTWAACTSQYLVSGCAGGLPLLCPGQTGELEAPALPAQFRLGMPFGASLPVAPMRSASVRLVGWPRSA